MNKAILPFGIIGVAVCLALACGSNPPKPEKDHTSIRQRAEANFDELDGKAPAPAASKKNAELQKAPAPALPPVAPLAIPAWVSEKPAANEVLGEAEGGATQLDAIAKAKSKAFSELAMRAGVTVSANLEINDQTNSSGASSYEIRDKSQLSAVPIKVEAFEFTKTFARQEDGGFHAWALLSIPPAEFARIKRNLDGLTAFVVTCDPSNGPKGKNLCAATQLENKARELAIGQGMKLKGAALKAPVTDVAGLAQSEAAAYYLEVKAEINKTLLDDPEHYVWITLSWRLFHTDKGAAIREVSVGPIKGGHYTYEDAMTMAIKKAVDELKAKVAAL